MLLQSSFLIPYNVLESTSSARFSSRGLLILEHIRFTTTCATSWLRVMLRLLNAVGYLLARMIGHHSSIRVPSYRRAIRLTGTPCARVCIVWYARVQIRFWDVIWDRINRSECRRTGCRRVCRLTFSLCWLDDYSRKSTARTLPLERPTYYCHCPLQIPASRCPFCQQDRTWRVYHR